MADVAVRPPLARTAPPERSELAHDFLFAAITAAWQSWPKEHPDSPFGSPDHLRAYLACHDEVMHCEEIRALPDEGIAADDAAAFFSGLMGQIRAAGGFCFLRSTSGRLSLRIPRTLKYERNGGIPRRVFGEVAEKMFTAIYREIGIEPEQLKREARRATTPAGVFRK